MSNTNDTVCFNVGGRIFETSRSLFDRYEDTVLATLVSDTWEDNPTKPPVFIDRNGDVFAHILDYLRYGSISLPLSVSKDMFLRDMDFFGIVPEEGTVKTYSEGWAREVSNRHQKITDLQYDFDIDLLAHFCASEHLKGNLMDTCGGIYIYIYPASAESDEAEYEDKCKLYSTAKVIASQTKHKEVFQVALSKFGLRLDRVELRGKKYKHAVQLWFGYL